MSDEQNTLTGSCLHKGENDMMTETELDDFVNELLEGDADDS